MDEFDEASDVILEGDADVQEVAEELENLDSELDELPDVGLYLLEEESERRSFLKNLEDVIECYGKK